MKLLRYNDNDKISFARKTLISRRIYLINPRFFFSIFWIMFYYKDIVKAPLKALVYPWIYKKVPWVKELYFLPVVSNIIYQLPEERVGDKWF